MGSFAAPPREPDSGDDSDEPSAKLGDALSGRLADVDLDSVEAVRDVRER